MTEVQFKNMMQRGLPLPIYGKDGVPPYDNTAPATTISNNINSNNTNNNPNIGNLSTINNNNASKLAVCEDRNLLLSNNNTNNKNV